MLKAEFDKQCAVSPNADAANFFTKIPRGEATVDDIAKKLPDVHPLLRPEDSFDVAKGVSGLVVFPDGEVIK